MIERIGTTSRIHGHDVHIRLPDRLYWRVTEVAEKTGLAINGSIRLLIERGLAEGVDPRQGGMYAELARELRALSQSNLGNLIATEEALLVLSDFFQGHGRKQGDFREEATNNARRRLLYVEKAVTDEAGL